jgi:hypothetical protein
VILDKLKKQDAKWEQRFVDLDAKWDRKFSERSEAVESRVGALELGALELGASSGSEVAARVTALEQAAVSGERVSKIEKVAASFEDWQPAVEGLLDDVKLEIRKLNKHLERVVLDHAPSSPTTS